MVLFVILCSCRSLSHGLVWSTIQVNETARMQCSEISELFWSGPYATRRCLDGGVWDEVDMSQCTMKNDRSSLIIYSTHLNMTNNGFHSESQITNEVFSYIIHIVIIVHLVVATTT